MAIESSRLLLERIYNASNANPKNFDFIRDVYAEPLLQNGSEMSLQVWQAFTDRFYSAFPDSVHELLDVTIDEDRVFNRYRLSGTHTGDLFLPVALNGRLIQTTGRKFEVWGLEFRRIREGRFVELWSSPILPQLLEQLEVP